MDRSKIIALALAGSVTVGGVAVYATHPFADDVATPTIVTPVQIKPAPADPESLHTDLLSGPVDPGATMETGVTLPAGMAALGIVPTSEALDCFDVAQLTHTPTTDGTGVYLSVQVRNRCDRPVRFTADVGYGAP